MSKKELTFKKLCELLREMFLFSLPDVFEVSYKDAGFFFVVVVGDCLLGLTPLLPPFLFPSLPSEGDIIHVASDIEVEEAIRQTSPTTTTTTTVVRLFLSSPSCPLSSPSQASAEQVLFCFVLLCFILFGFVWFCLVLFGFVLYVVLCFNCFFFCILSFSPSSPPTNP